MKSCLCVALSVIFFLTNVLTAYSAQSSFWAERQKTLKKRATVLPSYGATVSKGNSLKNSSTVTQGRSSTLLLAQLPSIQSQLTAGTGDLDSLVFPLSGGDGLGEGEKPNERRYAESWLTSILPYGSIRDVYLSRKKDAPLIIHIQDVHEVTEAQKNISNIITAIVDAQRNRSPKTDDRKPKTDGEFRISDFGSRTSVVIGLEGASGPFALEPYRAYPNRNITKGIAEYFMKEGYIGGPEFIGITAEEPPLFWGLEDLPLYEKNIQTIYDSQKNKPQLQAILNEFTKSAANLKGKVYSPQLKEFDQQYSAYKNEQEKLGAYVKYLMTTSSFSPLPKGEVFSDSPLPLGEGQGEGKRGQSLSLLSTRPSSQPSPLGRRRKNEKAQKRLFPNLNLLLQAFNLEETLDFKAVEQERLQLIETLVKKLTQEQLTELVQESLNYKLGHLNYSDYHQYLKQLCRNNGIPIQNFIKLNSYINYVGLTERINRNKLFDELANLEETAQNSLATTPEQKKLVAANRSLILLDKLLGHSMTTDDWKQYESLSSLSSLRFLSQKNQRLNEPNELNGLKELLMPFEDFCRYATKRNEALVENLLSQAQSSNPPSSPFSKGGKRGIMPLERNDAMDSTNPMNAVAVLVAGGFHTEGITQILRQKDVSYIVVTPKITEVPKETHYLDVFAREPLPIEKLFAGDIISLASQRLTAVNAIETPGSKLKVETYQSLYASLQVLINKIFVSSAIPSPLRGEGRGEGEQKYEERARAFNSIDTFEILEAPSREGIYTGLAFEENNDANYTIIGTEKSKFPMAEMLLPRAGFNYDDMLSQGELTIDETTTSKTKTIVFRIYKLANTKNFVLKHIKNLTVLVKANIAQFNTRLGLLFSFTRLSQATAMMSLAMTNTGSFMPVSGNAPAVAVTDTHLMALTVAIVSIGVWSVFSMLNRLFFKTREPFWRYVADFAAVTFIFSGFAFILANQHFVGALLVTASILTKIAIWATKHRFEKKHWDHFATNLRPPRKVVEIFLNSVTKKQKNISSEEKQPQLYLRELMGRDYRKLAGYLKEQLKHQGKTIKEFLESHDKLNPGDKWDNVEYIKQRINVTAQGIEIEELDTRSEVYRGLTEEFSRAYKAARILLEVIPHGAFEETIEKYTRRIAEIQQSQHKKGQEPGITGPLGLLGFWKPVIARLQRIKWLQKKEWADRTIVGTLGFVEEYLLFSGLVVSGLAWALNYAGLDASWALGIASLIRVAVFPALHWNSVYRLTGQGKFQTRAPTTGEPIPDQASRKDRITIIALGIVLQLAYLAPLYLHHMTFGTPFLFLAPLLPSLLHGPFHNSFLAPLFDLALGLAKVRKSSKPSPDKLREDLEKILNDLDPTVTINSEQMLINGIAKEIFEQDLTYDPVQQLKDSEKAYLEKAKDAVLIIYFDVQAKKREKLPNGFGKGHQGRLNARIIIRYLIEEEIRHKGWRIDRTLPTNVTIRWFTSHGLGGLLKGSFDYNPYEALEFAYPEHAYSPANPNHLFHPWDTQVFWTPELIREAIRHHIEVYHYIENGEYKEDTERGFSIDRKLPSKITVDWFRDDAQGLGGLLKRFDNSPYKALEFVYPEYAYSPANPNHIFHPWDATHVYWTDDLKREAIRHHVEVRHWKENGIDKEEPEKVFPLDRVKSGEFNTPWFEEQGLGGLLFQFQSSPYEAFKFAYPEKFDDGTLREEDFKGIRIRRGAARHRHLPRQIPLKSRTLTVENTRYKFEKDYAGFSVKKFSPERGVILDSETGQIIKFFVWYNGPRSRTKHPYVPIREKENDEELQPGHLIDVPRWLTKHYAYSSEEITETLAAQARIQVYDLPLELQGELIEKVNEVGNTLNLEVLTEYAKMTGSDGLIALTNTTFPTALVLVTVSNLFPVEELKNILRGYNEFNTRLTSVSDLFVKNLPKDVKSRYGELLEHFQSHIEEQLSIANDRIIYYISEAQPYIEKKDTGSLTSEDTKVLNGLFETLLQAHGDLKVIFETLDAFENGRLDVEHILLVNHKLITPKDQQYKLLAVRGDHFRIRAYNYKPYATSVGNVKIRLLLRPKEIESGDDKGEAAIRWSFWLESKDQKFSLDRKPDISFRLDRGLDPESGEMEVHLNIDSEALGNGRHYLFKDSADDEEEADGKRFAAPDFFAAIVESFVPLGMGISTGPASKQKPGKKGSLGFIGPWKRLGIISRLERFQQQGHTWTVVGLVGILSLLEEVIFSYGLLQHILPGFMSWALAVFGFPDLASANLFSHFLNLNLNLILSFILTNLIFGFAHTQIIRWQNGKLTDTGKAGWRHRLLLFPILGTAFRINYLAPGLVPINPLLLAIILHIFHNVGFSRFLSKMVFSFHLPSWLNIPLGMAFGDAEVKKLKEGTRIRHTALYPDIVFELRQDTELKEGATLAFKDNSAGVKGFMITKTTKTLLVVFQNDQWLKLEELSQRPKETELKYSSKESEITEQALSEKERTFEIGKIIVYQSKLYTVQGQVETTIAKTLTKGVRIKSMDGIEIEIFGPALDNIFYATEKDIEEINKLVQAKLLAEDARAFIAIYPGMLEKFGAKFVKTEISTLLTLEKQVGRGTGTAELLFNKELPSLSPIITPRNLQRFGEDIIHLVIKSELYSYRNTSDLVNLFGFDLIKSNWLEIKDLLKDDFPWEFMSEIIPSFKKKFGKRWFDDCLDEITRLSLLFWENPKRLMKELHEFPGPIQVAVFAAILKYAELDVINVALVFINKRVKSLFKSLTPELLGSLLVNSKNAWELVNDKWDKLPQSFKIVVTEEVLVQALYATDIAESAWRFLARRVDELPRSLKTAIIQKVLPAILIYSVDTGNAWQFLNKRWDVLPGSLKAVITDDQLTTALKQRHNIAMNAWQFLSDRWDTLSEPIKTRGFAAAIESPNMDVAKNAWLFLLKIQLPEKFFADYQLERLLYKAQPLQFSFLVYLQRPEYFHNRPVVKLFRALKEELKNYPEQDHSIIMGEFFKTISSYLETLNLGPEEYANIASLVGIVHANFHLVANSLMNIGISITPIQELINVLPINNPLTTIIRKLGEDERVGGFKDVVNLLINAGGFPHLYNLIINIARNKQRSAPAEVGGMLEVLRSYKNKLPYWGKKEWEIFADDIQAYYDAKFKVITLGLFTYFQKHKNDRAALKQLREDIDKESLATIANGRFFGLSSEVKKRYGLTDMDEIALLAKYLRIANFSTRDYETAYREVRDALNDKTPAKWQGEIPSSFRTLYSLKGTATKIVYEPDSITDRSQLEMLAQNLVKYAQASKEETPALSLEQLISGFQGDADTLKSLLINIVLAGEIEATMTYYAEFPTGIADQREWLSRWHTLIADTLKIDSKEKVTERVTELVAESHSDIASLEKTLAEYGLHLMDLSVLKRMPEPQKDLITYIQNHDQQGLSEFFQNNWFVLMETSQVSDEIVFRTWMDKSWGRFTNQLKGAQVSQEDFGFVRQTILNARQTYLQDQSKISNLRRKQLAQRLTNKLLNIFSDELSQLTHQLDFYREVKVPSEQKLYVGFFDDLLHLAGEFMMTGVCTWQERARQIKDGKREGYHFGTLALKDESGKVLGFSQVQLLKIPVKGQPDSQNMGYRVLSLTGINLSESEIPIDRETAVKALIRAAFMLNEAVGMQAAVVVANKGIHSNQNTVHNIIGELVRDGRLKTANLGSEVVLSQNPPYSYTGVYLISDLPEVGLTPITYEELAIQREQEDKLLEKSHLEFSNYMGHIIHNGEMPLSTAMQLKDKVENIINSMPQPLINDMKLNIMASDIAFHIVYEPALKQSAVARSEQGVTIYLGPDVLYDGGAKIETLTLRGLLADAVASFLMPDYETLKELAKTNGNAYFKLELVKGLLNYQAYLPLYHKVLNKYAWNPVNYWDEKTDEEKETFLRKYGDDLDRFTKGVNGVFQWNVFLNIMDDADPDFLVSNYLHLLLKNSAITEENIYDTINQIIELDITDKTSIVRLRNVMKEFFFDEKVRLKIGDNIVEKEKFNNFDDTEKLTAIKDAILASENINDFFHILLELFKYTLPLSDENVKQESANLFNKYRSIPPKEDRERILNELIKEFLVRRIGSNGFQALREHLTAQRGYKDIPYFDKLETELNMGDDADTYEFLRYVSRDIGYDFYSGEEKISESDKDWIAKLFKLFRSGRPDSETDTDTDKDEDDGNVLGLIGPWKPVIASLDRREWSGKTIAGALGFIEEYLLFSGLIVSGLAWALSYAGLDTTWALGIASAVRVGIFSRAHWNSVYRLTGQGKFQTRAPTTGVSQSEKTGFVPERLKSGITAFGNDDLKLGEPIPNQATWKDRITITLLGLVLQLAYIAPLHLHLMTFGTPFLLLAPLLPSLFHGLLHNSFVAPLFNLALGMVSKGTGHVYHIYKDGNLVKTFTGTIPVNELKGLDGVTIKGIKLDNGGKFTLGGGRIWVTFSEFPNAHVEADVENGLVVEVRILKPDGTWQRELFSRIYVKDEALNKEELVDTFYSVLGPKPFNELSEKLDKFTIKTVFSPSGRLGFGGKLWMTSPGFSNAHVEADVENGLVVEVRILKPDGAWQRELFSRIYVKDKTAKKEVLTDVFYGALLKKSFDNISRRLNTFTIKTTLNKFGQLTFAGQVWVVFSEFPNAHVEADVETGLVVEVRILKPDGSWQRKLFSRIYVKNEALNKEELVDTFYKVLGPKPFNELSGKFDKFTIKTVLDSSGYLTFGRRTWVAFTKFPNAHVEADVENGLVVEVRILKPDGAWQRELFSRIYVKDEALNKEELVDTFHGALGRKSLEELSERFDKFVIKTVLGAKGNLTFGGQHWTDFRLFPNAVVNAYVENGKVSWVKIIKDRQDSVVNSRTGTGYGQTKRRTLFPKELKFWTELASGLEETGLSNERAMITAKTLVRLKNGSLELLRQGGLLTESELKAIKELDLTLLDIQQFAKKIFEQIKLYQDNGLSQDMIDKILSTHLLPWNTIQRFQRIYRLGQDLKLIIRALGYSNVKQWIKRARETQEARGTLDIEKHLSRYDPGRMPVLTNQERQELITQLKTSAKALEGLRDLPAGEPISYKLVKIFPFNRYVVELVNPPSKLRIQRGQEFNLAENGLRFKVEEIDGRHVTIREVSGTEQRMPHTGALEYRTTDIAIKNQLERLNRVTGQLEKGTGLTTGSKKLDRFFGLIPLTVSDPDELTVTSFFNKNIPYSKKPEELESSGDQAQEMAVRLAMNKTEVTFIDGPAATGKTNVIAEIIHQAVSKGKKVLLVSQMHQAVDNALTEFINDLNIPVLRLGNDSGKFQYGTQQVWPGNKDAGIKREVLREFENRQRKSGGGYVMAATNAGIATDWFFRTQLMGRIPEFDMLIMDEASRETIAGALVPLSYLKEDGKIIMVGDIKQLSPVGPAEDAKKELQAKGITREDIKASETSILEWLLKRSYGDRVMLSTNYRSHPLLAGLASKLIYDGDVHSRGWEDFDVDTLNLRVIDIAEEPDVYYEKEGTRYINERSADEVIRLVQRYNSKLGIPLDKITVVTPYNEQNSYIEKLLEHTFQEEAKANKLPFVTTIDSYQGGENRAIILDFVRSNKEGRLGIVDDVQRLNVSLTRAQENLTIVWDSRVFSEDVTAASPEDVSIRELFKKIEAYYESEVLTFFPESSTLTETSDLKEENGITGSLALVGWLWKSVLKPIENRPIARWKLLGIVGILGALEEIIFSGGFTKYGGYLAQYLFGAGTVLGLPVDILSGSLVALGFFVLAHIKGVYRLTGQGKEQTLSPPTRPLTPTLSLKGRGETLGYLRPKGRGHEEGDTKGLLTVTVLGLALRIIYALTLAYLPINLITIDAHAYLPMMLHPLSNFLIPLLPGMAAHFIYNSVIAPKLGLALGLTTTHVGDKHWAQKTYLSSAVKHALSVLGTPNRNTTNPEKITVVGSQINQPVGPHSGNNQGIISKQTIFFTNLLTGHKNILGKWQNFNAQGSKTVDSFYAGVQQLNFVWMLLQELESLAWSYIKKFLGFDNHQAMTHFSQNHGRSEKSYVTNLGTVKGSRAYWMHIKEMIQKTIGINKKRASGRKISESVEQHLSRIHYAKLIRLNDNSGHTRGNMHDPTRAFSDTVRPIENQPNLGVIRQGQLSLKLKNPVFIGSRNQSIFNHTHSIARHYKAVKPSARPLDLIHWLWKPVIARLDKRGWSGRKIAGTLGLFEEYFLFSGLLVGGVAWVLSYAGIDSTWALVVASLIRVGLFSWAHWNSVYRLTGQGEFQTRAPTGESIPDQATWKDRITLTALGIILQLAYVVPFLLHLMTFSTAFLFLAPLLPSLLHGPFHNSFLAPVFKLALGLANVSKVSKPSHDELRQQLKFILNNPDTTVTITDEKLLVNGLADPFLIPEKIEANAHTSEKVYLELYNEKQRELEDIYTTKSRDLVMQIFKDVRAKKRPQVPRGFWEGHQGKLHERIIIKNIIEIEEGWTIDRELPKKTTFDWFRKHKLGGLLMRYKNWPYALLKIAYPLEAYDETKTEPQPNHIFHPWDGKIEEWDDDLGIRAIQHEIEYHGEDDNGNELGWEINRDLPKKATKRWFIIHRLSGFLQQPRFGGSPYNLLKFAYPKEAYDETKTDPQPDHVFHHWDGTMGEWEDDVAIRAVRHEIEQHDEDENGNEVGWAIDRKLPGKAIGLWFLKHGLGGLLAHERFKGSPYEILKFVYPKEAYDETKTDPQPDHVFHHWDGTMGEWEDDVAIRAVRHEIEQHGEDKNGNEIGWTIDRELPKKVTGPWLQKHGLLGLLSQPRFRNSPYEILKFAYPKEAYDETKTDPQPDHVFHHWDGTMSEWEDSLAQHALIHEVEQHGYHPYGRKGWKLDARLPKKATKRWFLKHGLGGLLSRYHNSPYNLFKFMYPEKFKDGTFSQEQFRFLLGTGAAKFLSPLRSLDFAGRINILGVEYKFSPSFANFLVKKLSRDYGALYTHGRGIVKLFPFKHKSVGRFFRVYENILNETVNKLTSFERQFFEQLKAHSEYQLFYENVTAIIAKQVKIPVYNLTFKEQIGLTGVFEQYKQFDEFERNDWDPIINWLEEAKKWRRDFIHAINALSQTKIPKVLIALKSMINQEEYRRFVVNYSLIDKKHYMASNLFTRNLNVEGTGEKLLDDFRNQIETQLKAANDRILNALYTVMEKRESVITRSGVPEKVKKEAERTSAQDMSDVLQAQRDLKTIIYVLDAFSQGKLAAKPIKYADGAKEYRFTLESFSGIRLILRPRERPIAMNGEKAQAGIRWTIIPEDFEKAGTSPQIEFRLDRESDRKTHIDLDSDVLDRLSRIDRLPAGHHYSLTNEEFAKADFVAKVVEGYVQNDNGGTPTALIGLWKPILKRLEGRPMARWKLLGIVGVMGALEEVIFSGGFTKYGGMLFQHLFGAGMVLGLPVDILGGSLVALGFFVLAHIMGVYRLTGQGKEQTLSPPTKPLTPTLSPEGRGDEKGDTKGLLTVTVLGLALRIIYALTLTYLPIDLIAIDVHAYIPTVLHPISNFLIPLLPGMAAHFMYNSIIAPKWNLGLGLVGKDKRGDEEKPDSRLRISGMTNREIRSGMANNRMVGVTAEKAVSDSGVKMRLAKELERSLLGVVAGSKTVSLTEYEMHLDAIVQHAVNNKETAKMAREKLEEFIKHGQAVKDEGSLVYEVSDEILRGVYPEQGRRTQNDRRGTQNDRMWKSEIASADVVSLAMTAQSDNSVFEKLARLHKSGKTLSDQDGLSGVFDELGINSEDKQKADLELVSFLIAADTVDNSLDKILSAGIETYNETMGLYMTSDRIETNAKEGIITGIELTENIVESKPSDNIDYGIIDKLVLLVKLIGEEETQVSHVPLIMPEGITVDENGFLSILKTYDQQTDWDQLKGRIVFVEKENIRDSGGKLSVRETRNKLGLNKDIRLDLFILDRAEWNIAGSDLVTHLLVMLTGDLIYDATHQIDENVERMAYLKIQA